MFLLLLGFYYCWSFFVYHVGLVGPTSTFSAFSVAVSPNVVVVVETNSYCFSFCIYCYTVDVHGSQKRTFVHLDSIVTLLSTVQNT